MLPRKKGDFEVNDDVYRELEKKDLRPLKQDQTLHISDDRKVRTLEEMTAESLILR